MIFLMTNIYILHGLCQSFQGAASMLHDAYLFVKIGFKALQYSSADPVFINITIGDYLWNYRSSLVSKAKAFLPFMVPTDNSGILHTVCLIHYHYGNCCLKL